MFGSHLESVVDHTSSPTALLPTFKATWPDADFVSRQTLWEPRVCVVHIVCPSVWICALYVVESEGLVVLALHILNPQLESGRC